MRVIKDVLRELITNKTTLTSEKSPSTFPSPRYIRTLSFGAFWPKNSYNLPASFQPLPKNQHNTSTNRYKMAQKIKTPKAICIMKKQTKKKYSMKQHHLVSVLWSASFQNHVKFRV